jgi:hypothetical protein
MYKYRTIEARVRESLRAFRVVSLTGARQVGKTTLDRHRDVLRFPPIRGHTLGQGCRTGDKRHFDPLRFSYLSILE